MLNTHVAESEFELNIQTDEPKEAVERKLTTLHYNSKCKEIFLRMLKCKMVHDRQIQDIVLTETDITYIQKADGLLPSGNT